MVTNSDLKECYKYDYCKKDDALMGYNCFMYEDPNNLDTYTLLTQYGKDSDADSLVVEGGNL